MAFTDPDLTTFSPPLAIRTDCITSHRTTLQVKQDKTALNKPFIAQSGDGTVTICGGSDWPSSGRKEFSDVKTGLPLYTLRQKWFLFRPAWRLELPGDGHKKIMVVRERWSLQGLRLDCSFITGASDGDRQKITLELREQDGHGSVTHINCGEHRVAGVRRISEKDHDGALLFKDEYEVEVAGGIDMVLMEESDQFTSKTFGVLHYVLGNAAQTDSDVWSQDVFPLAVSHLSITGTLAEAVFELLYYVHRFQILNCCVTLAVHLHPQVCVPASALLVRKSNTGLSMA
ncbi:MAG: hypothetical protein M1837_002500 [Sclerophora amabilis]|nr:MAG: hypothetical protein M1837_002500 [Sclerophora amabilis]